MEWPQVLRLILGTLTSLSSELLNVSGAFVTETSVSGCTLEIHPEAQMNEYYTMCIIFLNPWRPTLNSLKGNQLQQGRVEHREL